MSELRSIQPTGFHVGLSGDWLITAVSANIEHFLPASAADLLGQPITSLLSEDAIHDMRNRMALLRGDGTEHLFQYPLSKDGEPFDLAIYRNGEGYGLDAEPCDEHGFGNATGIVLGMLGQVEASDDVQSLCEQAARQLRALTGFERVAICAEGKLLGQSARTTGDLADPSAMLTANDIAIADCDAASIEIITDKETSGSRSSTLRSPTDEERECVRALGARAALVLPLERNGRPWGHIGCYHRSARHVSAERRNIARLFARIMSLSLELAELRSRG